MLVSPIQGIFITANPASGIEGGQQWWLQDGCGSTGARVGLEGKPQVGPRALQLRVPASQRLLTNPSRTRFQAMRKVTGPWSLWCRTCPPSRPPVCAWCERRLPNSNSHEQALQDGVPPLVRDPRQCPPGFTCPRPCVLRKPVLIATRPQCRHLHRGCV